MGKKNQPVVFDRDVVVTMLDGGASLDEIGAVFTCSGTCVLRYMRRENIAFGRLFDKFKYPEYTVWRSMIKRCTMKSDRNYKWWGARGICVSERWRGRRGFDNFLADVGRRPSSEYTIDRVDVNGNYEPGNVRWLHKSMQNRNKRNNRFVTAFGQTKTLAEWAEVSGLNYGTLRSRLKKMGPDQAFGTPPSCLDMCGNRTTVPSVFGSADSGEAAAQ